jgi:uncharacterized GH25 family protein
MKRMLTLAVMMLGLVTSASVAHDTWIICDPFVVPSGRLLTVRMTSGEKFPTMESAPEVDRIAKAEWRLGDKSGTISDFKKDAKSLAASGKVANDGVAVITVEFKPKEIELKPEEVSDYLEEIAAPASVRKAYEQDGAKAGWHETYTRHAKTYVKIGSGGDATGALGPVGFNIDFLPDSDPTALKVGDTLALKVIRGGLELESSPVFVVCGATGEAVMPRTNQTGMMLVKITAPGWWMVRTTQLRRQSAGVWESDFTTMTFYVEK